MTTDIPSCAKNHYSDYERYQRDFNELKEIFEKNFQNNILPAKIRSLTGDIKSIKTRLPDCQTSNPDYDFSDLISKQDMLIADFAQLNKDFDKKIKFGEDFHKKAYQVKLVLNAVKSLYEFVNHDEDNSFEKSDIDYIKEYQDDDSAFFHNTIKNSQEQIIEVSDNFNNDDYMESVYERIDEFYADDDKENGIEKTKAFTKDMLMFQELFDQDNDGLQELIGYGQKVLGKLGAANDDVIDSVAVSVFHKENINKVLFTNNIHLDPAKADASDFKTRFEAGENIKAIVYLSDKFSELYDTYNRISYNMSSPKNETDFVAENISEEEKGNGYIVFYIITEADHYINNQDDGCYTAYAMRFLTNLPPRPQKITISFNPHNSNSNQKIIGDFKFDCSDDAGLEKLKNEAMKIQDLELASVTLPEAKMSNEKYENQLLELFNSLGWDEDFKQAIIISKEWKYKKSLSGIIVARTLKVVMTANKGGKCQYQDFTVKQEKADAGYGSFDTHSVGSRVYIACDKI